MKITVNVTQEHIDRGIRQECRACPITLALSEICYSNVKILVGADDVEFGRPPDDWTSRPLPSIARTFVSLFDLRGRNAVAPFKFEMSVPPWAVDRIK